MPPAVKANRNQPGEKSSTKIQVSVQLWTEKTDLPLTQPLRI
jgi:hypothetical protein